MKDRKRENIADNKTGIIQPTEIQILPSGTLPAVAEPPFKSSKERKNGTLKKRIEYSRNRRNVIQLT